MTRGECKHPSAFCLMKYQTEDRAVEEVVWNSRDMAVPEEISRGKVAIKHVDAHRDEFKPFHVPRVGTRIFIDPIMDRLEDNAAEFYAEHHLDDDFVEHFGETKDLAIAKIVETQLKKLLQDGRQLAPALVVVTADLAARIETRLQKRGVR